MSNLTIHVKNINIDTLNIHTLPHSKKGKDKMTDTSFDIPEEKILEKQQGVSVDIQEKDMNDVTGFSPLFLSYLDRKISFQRNRWSEVIREIIKLCSLSIEDFTNKIAVFHKRDQDKHNVRAIFGEANGFYVIPERNGWIYIPEYDISVRIRTGNKMLQMVKDLVKKTAYEGRITLFLKHDNEKDLYRHMNI